MTIRRWGCRRRTSCEYTPYEASELIAEYMRSRLREAAVRQLHAVGVHHGQLFERDEALCLSDGRHFLRAADGTLRIVDFQRAFMHRCIDKDVDWDSISDADDDSSELEEICDELLRAFGHYQRALEGELRTTPWNAF